MRASDPFLWCLAVFQPSPLKNSSPCLCSALPAGEDSPCSAARTYKPHGALWGSEGESEAVLLKTFKQPFPFLLPTICAAHCMSSWNLSIFGYVHAMWYKRTLPPAGMFGCQHKPSTPLSLVVSECSVCSHTRTTNGVSFVHLQVCLKVKNK